MLLLGLALAWAIHVSGRSQRGALLAGEVEEIARAVELRMAQNVSVLRAVKALFELEPQRMTRERFAQFVSKIDLAHAYPGMRGVGFAARIPLGAEEAAVRRFELPRPVHPDTTQTVRAPVSLLEPRDARNEAALGFDMYSEPTRRAAMIEAEASDQPVATAPVVLRQEITEDVQNGFLVYLATRDAQGGVEGFAYAPFRIGELLSDAGLRRLIDRYAVRLDDVTGEAPMTLYASALAGAGSREAAAEVQIAARRWRISIGAVKNAAWTETLRPLGVAALALILASLVAAAYRDQQRAQEIESALAAERLKALSEREVLLQEMNHRIKNAIARIGAIARSTARSAADLADFQTSFSGRLAAMAAAQDLVTRSTEADASLRDVFAAELDQIFPQGDARLTVQGEAAMLDGRLTQALALVVHELATNAAKHGAARDPAGKLAVNWVRAADGGLTIDWNETCAPAPVETPRKGFGSRLISMIVEGELKGRVERDLTPNGLRLRLHIPAAPPAT